LINRNEWKELSKNLTVGKEFVILDAGHINYDVALYYVNSISPLQFREKAGNSPGTVGVLGGVRLNNKTVLPDATKELHNKIVAKVKSIMKEAKVLYFVGNGEGNAKLLEKLKGKFRGIEIKSIEHQNAADGVLHWFNEGAVVAHAVPRSYGIEIWRPYDEDEAYMDGRTPIDCLDGELVRHGWSPIVRHDQVLEGRTKHEMEFSKMFASKDPELLKFDVTVYSATPTANNYWICDNEGNLNEGFTELFEIKADLSKLKDELSLQWDEEYPYYRLDFKIEMVFDSINLHANIICNERKFGQPPFQLVKDGGFHRTSG